MKSLNVFAGAFVDRSAHRRNDPNWIRDMLGSPEARFAPVWRNRCLIDGNPPRAALLRTMRVGSRMKGRIRRKCGGGGARAGRRQAVEVIAASHTDCHSGVHGVDAFACSVVRWRVGVLGAAR